MPFLRSIGFNGRSLGLYLQALHIASPKRDKQLHRKTLLSSFDLNALNCNSQYWRSLSFSLFFSVNYLFNSSVTHPPPPAGTGGRYIPRPAVLFFVRAHEHNRLFRRNK